MDPDYDEVDEDDSDDGDDEDSSDDEDDSEDVKIYLWKDPSENNWLGVNPDDNSAVFVQMYRPDLNKTLILSFDGGLTNYGSSVSYYNFHIFDCPNH